MTLRMDNRTYYDDFAGWYERERGRGYHQMIDDLEVSLVERYAVGGRVLEVGCGTGLLLDRVRLFASYATGMDLSSRMLARARQRDLPVISADATLLPFPDNCFDVVYSFKVLPHVADIRAALSEMSRVTRPGGYVLAEFYNVHSLRYLVKRLKPPSAISEHTTDRQVYTRYDTFARIVNYLPPGLELDTVRGIRIVTPLSHVHRVPGLSWLFRAAEEHLADAPVVRNFGGFLVAVSRKQDPQDPDRRQCQEGTRIEPKLRL
ncbi:MAG: class I SAM-dependent methyltransferase [Proteobacteria bacterium]|nr:class I SAM-dependent methyltransferase [Pseudomonadota bacterium]